MKNIKLFLMMIIPAILLSCNNPNRNKAKDMNEGGMSVTNNDTRDKDNASVKANESTSNKDEEFAKDAASGGLKEVELGKLAQQHAQSQRVKNFAAMMVKDHSKANQELKTIASGKNIMLPEAMENSDNKVVNDLQNEKGADFDRKYIKEMVDDHEKDVDEFKKQAENGTDPELKAFATKVLPVLLAHQDSAKSIRDALR
jgi:putative membrane protein